jgi:Neurotransmitter-gated ion-channel ligand binding domain
MNKNQLAAKVMAGLVSLALTVVMSNYSPVAAQNTPRNSPVQQATTTATQPAAKPAETRKPSIKSDRSIDKPTLVSVGFSLINLGRINQTDETFDVSGFLQATWQDPRLAFDPNAVGDKVIRYTPEQIWEPALTIFNSQSAPKRGTVQLTAKPDGTVTYLEQVNATVSSQFDFRKFPFDSETATIIRTSGLKTPVL